MKKRIAAVILSMVLGAGMLAGCGQKNTTDADASSTTEVSADAEKADSAATDSSAEDANVLEDGTYSVNVELSGGSGRATVDSPATVTVTDGQGNGNHRLEQYPLRLHDRRWRKIYE